MERGRTGLPPCSHWPFQHPLQKLPSRVSHKRLRDHKVFYTDAVLSTQSVFQDLISPLVGLKLQFDQLSGSKGNWQTETFFHSQNPTLKFSIKQTGQIAVFRSMVQILLQSTICEITPYPKAELTRCNSAIHRIVLAHE